MSILEDKDIVVPEGVTDVDQYRKWYKLKNEIDSDPERFYRYTDDKNQVHSIDLYSPITRIREKYKSIVDPKTFAMLEKKANAFKSRTARCTSEKRKIGGINGGYFDIEGYLNSKATELLDMFGKYWTTEEVHRHIVEKWKQNVALSAVKGFYVKHKEQILRFRAQWDDDYTDISIHSKRARLGQLNYLIQTRRQIYDKTHKIEDSKEIRAILEQAKNEIEGNKLQLTVDGKIDVDLTINIEQQIKTIGGLTLGQLIVSMTAGKLGVNPLFLMSKLSNSVYNKFNGFKRNNMMMKESPFRPSELVYNFEEIKENNKVYEQDLPKQLYNKPIEDAQVISEVTSIKERLLQKIKSRVDETNKNIEQANGGF